MTRSIVLLILLAACTVTPGDDSPPTTEDPPPTTADSPPTTAGRLDTGDLGLVAVSTVIVGERTLDVAVASTPQARSQGLRVVEDLGDLDGMLFTWGGDMVTSRFTMQDTVIPLDITFFDDAGRFVDGFTMTPCETSPCPSYAASGPYAYAVEVPAGSQPDIGAGSTLSFTD